MEDVFFGVSDGVSESCFSSTLDELLPAWEDSWFALGDGCADKPVTCGQSPSHESDSGLSSVCMSDVRSPQSLSGEDIVMDFNNPDRAPCMAEGKDLFEEDILSFLMSSQSDNEVTAAETPGSHDGLEHYSAADAESLDCNMNVKVEDTKSSGKTYNVRTNPAPHSFTTPVVLCEKIDSLPKTVVKPTEKVVISPVPTKNSSVKVVKLVTPIAVGKPVTTDDVVKAIEVKNKKNAQNAKMNREKKKTYIKGLEDEVDSLKTENRSLKQEAKALKNERSSLQEEVAYLKSVLANESSLSALLQNIPSVKNVKLSSSFLSPKRNAEEDHDYGRVSTKRRKAGVCLHVEGESVSLEFCSHCAEKAAKSPVDK